MNSDLLLETEKLTRSWAQHEAAWLGSYLVAGVEDPRINLQSILSRHFLVRSVLPNPPEALMAHEYRFSAVMNWLLGAAAQHTDLETRMAILHALKRHSDNAEGLAIPHYVTQTFGILPTETNGCVIPNYLEALLLQPELDGKSVGPVLDTFGRLWSNALAPKLPTSTGDPESPGPQGPQADPLRPQQLTGLKSLLEPACGSANDYRFLHSYGMARLFSYSGFDLCQKNIANARALFPAVQFNQGNVFEISAPSKAFDLCLVHDLFEHLSLAGLEQAVEEITRVTREGICAGFFQMDEIQEHTVRPRDDYYWNLLSLCRMRELFAHYGFRGQAIHIDTFLSYHLGSAQTHNPNAYTFLLFRTTHPHLDETPATG